jgi:hypothetical protein
VTANVRADDAATFADVTNGLRVVATADLARSDNGRRDGVPRPGSDRPDWPPSHATSVDACPDGSGRQR